MKHLECMRGYSRINTKNVH